MKKILLFGILLLSINVSDAQNFWKRKANMPFGRYGAVSFVIGNKAYVGTGDNTYIYDPLKKDFWEYNPGGTNCGGTWTQLADFEGTKRREAAAFSIGNIGYVGTGYDGTLTKDFWKYDPVTNDWDTITSFPGTARDGAVGFTINGKGYVGTGTDAGGGTVDFYEYDPAIGVGGTWTPKANFRGGIRTLATAFVINNKAYVGTGGGPTSWTKDLWEYDPTISDSGTWIPKTDFGGSARGFASSFSLNGKGYLGGGDDGGWLSDFWEYDPTTGSGGSWTPRPNYAGGNSSTNDGVGFSIGSKGYLGLGRWTSGELWEYSPPIAPYAPDFWEQKASLGAFGGGVRFESVAFSIGNKGYIGTGGNITGGVSADFWMFNPDNNTWTQKMDFANGTAGGRAGAVGFNIGGEGYVGLGSDNSSNRNDLWEYDTASNSWTQKANFPPGGRQGAVGFSIGTKGYVGMGGGQNDFWEFIPAPGVLAGTWTQKPGFPSFPRDGAVGFSIGNKGYVGIGDNVSPYLDPNDFWEYDPSKESDLNGPWTQKANFTGVRRNAAIGFSIGSSGFVGLNSDPNNLCGAPNDFWEYIPDSNQWVQREHFWGSTTRPRQSAVGFSIGDKGYVGTGFEGMPGIKDDIWEYLPVLNTITTGTISGSPFCVGSVVTVSFTTIGTAYSGNMFVAQLSNSSGNFSSPVNIGTYTATTAGSFSATIPSNTLQGGGYRIRVISTNPIRHGSDNGADITIKAIPPTANAGPDQTGASTCGLTMVTLAGNSPGPGTGLWSIVSGTGGSFDDASSPSSTFTGVAGNTYTLKWTLSNPPCNSSLDDVVITFTPSTTEVCNGIDDDCDGLIDEGNVCGSPVQISIADKSIQEGNSGQKTMRFKVTLNMASQQTVQVSFNTANGTAIAPGDYVAKSGTITFTPGRITRRIKINIKGDILPEANETFTVNLSNPVNATIADGTATGTILNDDGAALTQTVTKTNNNTDNRSVKVTPVPARNILYVQLIGYTGNNITLQLSSLDGRVLKQEKIQAAFVKFVQHQINVADLVSGVYFLTVIDSKGNRQTAKVIVAR